MVSMLQATYDLVEPWKSVKNGGAPDGGGAEGRRPAQVGEGTTSGSRGCILLVDDDSAVRETLAELLEDVGFHTIQAADAEEAMTLLRQTVLVHVLVTDLTMPGDDGIALIRQAHAIRNDLPAILLTGYAEQGTTVMTTQGSNYHVLCKPVESDRLIEQLELLVTRPDP